MQTTRSGSPEAQGQLGDLGFRLSLPEDLTAARRAVGLADPTPINSEEAYRIRMALGLEQAQFGQLLGVSVRSVVNYENGKAIPEPTLIIYGILKDRIMREVQKRSDGGSESDLSRFTLDELKAEITSRAVAWVMDGTLPEPAVAKGPGRPRTRRDIDTTPKNPVGRPRKYPRDDD